MRPLPRFLFFGLLLPFFTVAQNIKLPGDWNTLHDSTGWILASSTGRVSVYSKQLSASPVPAFRFELLTLAAPNIIMEFIWAVDKYPETFSGNHIPEAGFFERAADCQTAWQIMDIPFLALRMYQYIQWRQGLIVGWDKISSALPVSGFEDIIIPPVNFGSWEIIPGQETNKLIYRVCTNPGGSVPAWVVNAANKRYLPQMLLDLEKAALKAANESRTNSE